MHAEMIFYILLSMGRHFVKGADSTDAAPTYCSSDSRLCIASALDSQNNICFTFYSDYLSNSGWVALGIGSDKMAGADMYVAWQNSQKTGATIANLRGTGHSTPRSNSVQNAKYSSIVPQRSDIKSNGAASFCRPIDVSSGSTVQNGPRSYIWAYSSRGPSGNIDSPSASIAMHEKYGTFTFNFMPKVANSFKASGNGRISGLSSQTQNVTSTTTRAREATSTGLSSTNPNVPPPASSSKTNTTTNSLAGAKPKTNSSLVYHNDTSSKVSLFVFILFAISIL